MSVPKHMLKPKSRTQQFKAEVAAPNTILGDIADAVSAFIGDPPKNYTFRRTVGYVLHNSPAGTWWEALQTSLSLLGELGRWCCTIHDSA